VELLSFGGADTVRGFRKDALLGRRLWAVQNELWFTLPGRASHNSFWRAIATRGQLATLYDFGGIHQVRDGRPGTRQGAGGGLRIQIQRAVFMKIDYAYGFGVDSKQQRGRWFFNVEYNQR
jgi:hemolysin activation/secretion protein